MDTMLQNHLLMIKDPAFSIILSLICISVIHLSLFGASVLLSIMLGTGQIKMRKTEGAKSPAGETGSRHN